jgi:hypothetical protein
MTSEYVSESVEGHMKGNEETGPKRIYVDESDGPYADKECIHNVTRRVVSKR